MPLLKLKMEVCDTCLGDSRLCKCWICPDCEEMIPKDDTHFIGVVAYCADCGEAKEIADGTI